MQSLKCALTGQFLVLSFCGVLHDGFNDTTYRRCCTLEMSGSAFFSNLIFCVLVDVSL